MNPPSGPRLLPAARFGPVGAILLAGLAAATPARAEELRLLAAGAVESTLREVLPTFEAAHGKPVRVTYGAVGQLRDMLLNGAPADVAIVTPAILAELEPKGLLRAGSRVDLGRVGGGIAVRAGAERPAIDTPEALRRALLAADEIFYADPAIATAGAYLLVVADRLGVGAEVRRKGRTAAGGKEAMQLMARSTGRAIGLTQVSEILSVPEVVLVGPYPGDLQRETTYSGVVMAGARQPERAQALLRFLAGPAVQGRLRGAGYPPPR